MRPKIIRTEEDYNAALARIEDIIDAKRNTPEGDELELLSHLVELYEDVAHPIELPTPIEAIRFRMEQQGLRQKDLCRYIGSPGKVSEVLSGKRALSKSMIAKLHEGLGIPLAALLNTPSSSVEGVSSTFNWTKFPLAEMGRRGWICLPTGGMPSSEPEARSILQPFFEPVLPDIKNAIAARQKVRLGSNSDSYALLAWRAKVLLLARDGKLPPYINGTLKSDFMRQLVQLSYLEQGPKLAKEFLAKSGVHLLILKQLPRMFLDGAAMFTAEGRPLIALTLRHDRLDNFWFTLCHELGHVAMHLENDHTSCFMDDLDKKDAGSSEEEADRFAADSLIPPEVWRNLHRTKRISTAQVRQTAADLRVHPSIVAGRIQFERKKYTIFRKLLGQGNVGHLFDS